MSVETVRSVSVPGDPVSAPARIEANPNRIGRASMPVPGRVVRVAVKLGDSVQKGQQLAAIDSPLASEAESSYAQADAAVRQAIAAAAKAEADLARLADLYEHRAAAQKDLLAAQTAADVAKTAVEQARSAKDQAQRRLELLGLVPGRLGQLVAVTAPLSGKVLEISVVEGEFRNEISTPLVTIADLSHVWATSDVPESKIRYCKPGGLADLELIAYPGERFRARVTRIADTVNTETRSIKVSAELENAGGRLRPEMYGSLRYSDAAVSAMWAPEAAVVRVGDKDFVFVEQAPGHFRSAPVKLGPRHDGGYTIVDGLKSTDRIVTRGSVYLKAAL